MYICVCVHPVCVYVCRRVCTRAYSIWYELTTLIWSSPHPSGSFYWGFFTQNISGEIVVKKLYISQVPLKYVCQWMPPPFIVYSVCTLWMTFTHQIYERLAAYISVTRSYIWNVTVIHIEFNQLYIHNELNVYILYVYISYVSRRLYISIK